MNGDFVGHGRFRKERLSLEELVDIWKSVFDEVRAHKNYVTLLPTIGNNDMMVADEVPCTETDKEAFYSALFDIWFK